MYHPGIAVQETVTRREPGHGVDDGNGGKWCWVWARSELGVGRAAGGPQCRGLPALF